MKWLRQPAFELTRAVIEHLVTPLVARTGALDQAEAFLRSRLAQNLVEGHFPDNVVGMHLNRPTRAIGRYCLDSYLQQCEPSPHLAARCLDALIRHPSDSEYERVVARMRRLLPAEVSTAELELLLNLWIKTGALGGIALYGGSHITRLVTGGMEPHIDGLEAERVLKLVGGLLQGQPTVGITRVRPLHCGEQTWAEVLEAVEEAIGGVVARYEAKGAAGEADAKWRMLHLLNGEV